MPEASSSTTSLLNRRTFLAQAGVAAASLTLLNACKDPAPTPTTTASFAFSGGDAGVLSYLYVLQRFQADFYKKVLDTPPSDLTAADTATLRDLYRHHLVQRETLVQVFNTGVNSLSLDANLKIIEFKYDTFTLTSRTGVLAAAQTVEDFCLAAHCGAAKLLTSTTFLQLLLKIMSVEARHASTMRDLNAAGSFASNDVVPTSGATAGLNQLLTPTAALAEFSAKYSPLQLLPGSLPTR